MNPGRASPAGWTASSCRSRYRAERIGRMKADWTPVAPAMKSFSSPYGSRTRITRLRVSYPAPLEERAMLSVRRDGVEPPQRLRVGYSHLGSPMPSRRMLFQ